MEYIVTSIPDHFLAMEDAEMRAAELCETTGQTFYVLPVTRRIPGMKYENVGVLATPEED